MKCLNKCNLSLENWNVTKFRTLQIFLVMSTIPLSVAVRIKQALQEGLSSTKQWETSQGHVRNKGATSFSHPLYFSTGQMVRKLYYVTLQNNFLEMRVKCRMENVIWKQRLKILGTESKICLLKLQVSQIEHIHLAGTFVTNSTETSFEGTLSWIIKGKKKSAVIVLKILKQLSVYWRGK